MVILLLFGCFSEGVSTGCLCLGCVEGGLSLGLFFVLVIVV